MARIRECVSVLVVAAIIGTVHGQTLVRSRTSATWKPRARGVECNEQDCRLPKCSCPGMEGPSKIKKSELPQIVMLTFDDSINEQVFPFYKKLLRPDRKNPNGCPMSATFYVSHNWTNYDMVRELYLRGNEIASHTVSHRLPQTWWTNATQETWEKEVDGQRNNIARLASVPQTEVKGMRVPFLETGGDEQFKMMEEKGYEYDASFMTGPRKDGGVWPFTLDYDPTWKYCSNNNCPKSSFPGIWEIPMNRWVGPDGTACAMVDACQTQPKDKEDTLGFMWYNFNRFYKGNRAPFGIFVHATWFKKDRAYLDAMDAFLQELDELDDVYVVSAHQVIEWMRYPVSLRLADKFIPWRRTCEDPKKRHLIRYISGTQKAQTQTSTTSKIDETTDSPISKSTQSDDETKSSKPTNAASSSSSSTTFKGNPSTSPSPLTTRSSRYPNGQRSRVSIPRRPPYTRTRGMVPMPRQLSTEQRAELEKLNRVPYPNSVRPPSLPPSGVHTPGHIPRRGGPYGNNRPDESSNEFNQHNVIRNGPISRHPLFGRRGGQHYPQGHHPHERPNERPQERPLEHTGQSRPRYPQEVEGKEGTGAGTGLYEPLENNKIPNEGAEDKVVNVDKGVSDSKFDMGNTHGMGNKDGVRSTPHPTAGSKAPPPGKDPGVPRGNAAVDSKGKTLRGGGKGHAERQNRNQANHLKPSVLLPIFIVSLTAYQKLLL